VRAELRIPEEALVIVCVGRFVPEKGHVYLFEALRQLKDRMTQEGISNVHILAVGNGVSRERPDFAKLADIGWPPDSCHFLGRRADVARLLRAADLFVLPSVSEAFPNSLVEAMATGLPCITTDVGECQTLVSDARFLVAPKDVERLSAAVLEVLGMDGSERVEIGRENRAKVFEQFTIEKMVRRFDAVFLDAAKLWNSARK
jgi:glycosyltransferase involved in cell wall biosynthesis